MARATFGKVVYFGIYFHIKNVSWQGGMTPGRKWSRNGRLIAHMTNIKQKMQNGSK